MHRNWEKTDPSGNVGRKKQKQMIQYIKNVYSMFIYLFNVYLFIVYRFKMFIFICKKFIEDFGEEQNCGEQTVEINRPFFCFCFEDLDHFFAVFSSRFSQLFLRFLTVSCQNTNCHPTFLTLTNKYLRYQTFFLPSCGRAKFNYFQIFNQKFISLDYTCSCRKSWIKLKKTPHVQTTCHGDWFWGLIIPTTNYSNLNIVVLKMWFD